MNKKYGFISIFKSERQFLSRYATLLVSIFGLLTLTAAFFLLGQSIASESRRNTDLLNAIGLEKKLTQQISKEILVIQKEWTSGRKFNAKSFGSLSYAADTFDLVRSGFLSGSKYQAGLLLRSIPMFPAEYSKELDEITNAWAPLRAQIDVLGKVYGETSKTKPTKQEEFMSGRKTFETEINESNKDAAFPNDKVNLQEEFTPLLPMTRGKEILGAEITKTSNTYNQYAEELSAKVESLNVRLNREISEQESKNAQYQFSMTAASLFLSFIMTFYFLRRNIIADYVITVENREKKAVLANVNEGLFLMDRNWVVISEGSSFLKKLFGQEVLVGSSFGSLMSRCAGRDLFASGQKYVRILIEKKASPSLVGSLNPWRLVAISVPDKSGHEVVKHVSVVFGPIYDSSGILSSVLVNISDSTDKKKLTEELKEEIKRNKEVFKMLAGLSESPVKVEILNFFKRLRTLLDQVNSGIKALGLNRKQIEGLVKNLKLEAHGYKSEAGVLGLDLIKKHLHDLESLLISLEKKGGFVYEDMLMIPCKFNDLYESIGFLESILSAKDGASKAQIKKEPDVLAKHVDVVGYIDALAKKTAQEHGKQVHVKWSGISNLPMRHAEVLKVALGHVVKNAVVHGLESVERRTALGKSPKGLIEITAAEAGSFVAVLVKDDGAGLDLKRIHKLAVERGHVEDFVGAVDSLDIFDMIFEEGVSTKERADMDSGHGIGLHYVKSRVEELGGMVWGKSAAGVGAQIVLRFPK